MKILSIVVIVIVNSTSLLAQESAAEIFWKTLRKHCGSAYEGTLVESAANDTFAGKKLVMHMQD